MKKLLAAIIVAIMIIAGTVFVGCNSGLPPIDSAFSNYQFMSVQTAYEKGFLSREDIKYVAYSHMGKVIEFVGENGDEYVCAWCCTPEEEWTKHRTIEFVPNRTAEEIPLEVATAAKNRFARNVHSPSWSRDGYSLRDIYNSLTVRNYLGNFNGAHLFVITSHLWDYPAVWLHARVSNIVWGHGARTTTVFVYVPTNEAVLQHRSVSFRVAVEGGYLKDDSDTVRISIEATARQNMNLELTSNAWRGAPEAIRMRLYDNGSIATMFGAATDDWAMVRVRRGDVFTNVVTLTPEHFLCCCGPTALQGNFNIQIRGDWMPAGEWLCTDIMIYININLY